MIFSASSSQLQWKCPLFQTLLWRPQRELKNNRKVNRLTFRLMEKQSWPILDSRSIGGFIVTSAPSPHDIACSTSSSVLQIPGTPELSIRGRASGSKQHQRLKHNNPRMPFPCTGARCKLSYEKYVWPQCYSYQ